MPTPHKSRQNTWTLLFTRARACGWRCSQHLEAVGTLNVQLALALSQLALALSQLAFVLSQLAFALSQLAFVLSQLALVLSQLALVLSGRCTAAARFGPRTCGGVLRGAVEDRCVTHLRTIASYGTSITSAPLKGKGGVDAWIRYPSLSLPLDSLTDSTSI